MVAPGGGGGTAVEVFLGPVADGFEPGWAACAYAAGGDNERVADWPSAFGSAAAGVAALRAAGWIA